MLTLSRKIRSAIRRYDYESAFIMGPQGMGKTTYGMLVLYEIYRDWDLVLHYTVFDPKPVLLELKESLLSGKRIPAIMFDDAGIHLSKYLPQMEGNAELVMVINATFNLIRTVTGGVMFTSPDMDILKELRKKSWWVGEPTAPHGREHPKRRMVLYRKRIMASGQTRIYRTAEDEYWLNIIPADVRKEYEEKRREALLPVIDRLIKLLDAGGKKTKIARKLLKKAWSISDNHIKKHIKSLYIPP